MIGVVMLEDFSSREYREPRAVPCEVISRVRAVSHPLRQCWHRLFVEWGLVSVLVEGESEPRDVSACRVIVDGVPLWPRKA